MKKLLLSLVLFVSFPGHAYASLWTSAVPSQIHLIPEGMVLLGDFDNSGVVCASGSSAVFLPKVDPMFKEKLTLALTAKATEKEIRVLIEDPLTPACVDIIGIGLVPVVSHYFWQLLD